MKISNWILLIGAIVLLAGAVLRVCNIEPYADYVLVAGAILVVIRGFIRTHEKDE